MNKNPNQPKEFDAVLGGEAPPPLEGVVLGGLEGVKRRLTSPVVEARVAALSEALNYGESGLDLVIGALNDSAKPVLRSACRLLRERAEPHVKQVLVKYWNHDPSLFFTTWANWKVENFDPKIGITDPAGIAYSLKIDQFNILLQYPQANKIEALVCQMRDCNHSSGAFVDVFCAAHKQLSSLKAVFIGDTEEPEYMSESLKLGNFSPILKAYPNLEVLQVRGWKGLEFMRVGQHDNLKTLILETENLVDETIDYLCTLDLPALEYLDLWLGKDYYNEKSTTNVLIPILSGKIFPKLRYLGLRGNEYYDKIGFALAHSAIVDRLMVLDLSKGTLGDKGAEALLKSKAINRLQTLNLSMNRLSTQMVKRLSDLNCRVIANSQYEYRYYSVWE